jgi:2'-5' RNA ligase
MRLFIALALPTEVEQKLGQTIVLLKKSQAPVKWVKPENIHLTLRFLSETDPALVPNLKKLIDRIGAESSPLRIVSNKIGAFPNLKRPRVLFAGLDGNDIEKMSELAAEIESGVRTLGFEPDERAFRPHLTLGRLRDPRRTEDLPDIMNNLSFEPIEFVFDKLVLFKSTLTPTGPIYDRLHEITLAERFGD